MLPRSLSIAAVLAVALVLGTTLSACNNNATKSAQLVARVNGKTIDSSDVQKQLDQFKSVSPAMFQGPDGAKREAEVRASIVRNLIEQALTQQAGTDLGITIDQKAVDDYVAKLAKAYGGIKNLQDALGRSGMTMARLRESVSARMLRDAIAAKLSQSAPPTEAEIQAYYDQNLAQFKAAKMVHLAQILLPPTDKTLAQQLYKQVKEGDDIAALAKVNSIDKATKDIGGDMGWQLLANYVPIFAKAVGSMKPGAVATVEDQFGLHVVKMIELQKARQKPLAEVRTQVIQILDESRRTAALNDYLAGLRKKATLDIPDATLKKAVEQSTSTSAAAGS